MGEMDAGNRCEQLHQTNEELAIELIEGKREAEEIAENAKLCKLSQTLECNTLSETVVQLEANVVALTTLETDAGNRCARLRQNNEELISLHREQLHCRETEDVCHRGILAEQKQEHVYKCSQFSENALEPISE